jgi:hypothetical protein
MTVLNDRSRNLRHVSIAVCFVLWAFSGAQAQTPDRNRLWTTVGSGGTLDEADVKKVFFDRSIVQTGQALGPVGGVSTPAALVFSQTESAVIRYNVTPVDGLFVPTGPCQPGTGCQGFQLKLRYLKAGPRAHVIAKLIEVDLATGLETVRLTFDSSAFPAANDYQVQQVGECGTRGFDFKLKGYYVEATLTRSSIFAGSAAGIQMIKIGNDICPG